MNTAQIIWSLVTLVAAVAAWMDWRTRRIPNWITVPGMILGVATNTILAGWHGAKVSLEGAGLALVLLLPFVLLRGLGAGDWKLMGALGAFLGPVPFLLTLLGSVLVSGVMAFVHLCRLGHFADTVKNIYILLRGWVSFGLRTRPEISLDNPKLIKLPFGVAAAIATVICCAIQWPF